MVNLKIKAFMLSIKILKKFISILIVDIKYKISVLHNQAVYSLPY
jgi:hypothetical protein